jgi:electron transfer flavoprotein alpha subunit
MGARIFAYILHREGVLDDTALELMGAARKLDPSAPVTALVTGSGDKLETVCREISSAFQEVWKIDNVALAYPDSEIIRSLLVRILPRDAVVLVPHEHFGMELSPGLSVKLESVYLPDAVDFLGMENGKLKAVREEYSGLVSAHVECELSQGAVITVRPGSFKADENRAAAGQVVDKTGEALARGLPASGRRFLEVVEADAGDVDITKSEVLVSVGRGIEDAENMQIVFDLAKAMGADVSCSRPIVDAKWLEKPRQVGSSGKTVKPKVYMACGISGSFQHLAGLKGNPLVIAINKNANAPIFQRADIGVQADILEFLPALTDRIKELK